MINKIKNLLYTYRFEYSVFFLLSAIFLCSLPEELHGWNSAWYAMNYSLGFDSRLLIGSFLNLFFPEFLPADAVYTFVLFSIFLVLLLLALCLGYALRQLKNTKAFTGLLILVTFYLLCPGSPAYLWTAENMGRFDLYLLLFTLAAAIFCLKTASVTVRLIAFTIAGLIGLCIHQAFMFIFFPLLFTMYMDALTDEKTKKGHIAFALLGMTSMCLLFLYFQFFSHINAGSIEELTAFLTGRTDLAVNEVALRYEYFASTAESSRELVLNQLGERIRYGFVTVVLLSPLAAVYGYLWFHILRGKNKYKFKYILILLSQLSFVPAFLLTIDWGRWFGAFLTVLALQLILLAAKKDAVVTDALSTLSSVFHKHPFLFIITGIWLASLGKFQATLLPDAPVFFASAYKLFSTFF